MVGITPAFFCADCVQAGPAYPRDQEKTTSTAADRFHVVAAKKGTFFAGADSKASAAFLFLTVLFQTAGNDLSAWFGTIDLRHFAVYFYQADLVQAVDYDLPAWSAMIRLQRLAPL